MNILDTPVWDKAYSIGHEKIDSEHRRLFEIASELDKYSSDLKMIIKVVRELVSYTKLHFRNEENFMRSILYKDLDGHILLHKKLADKLAVIIKDINDKPLEEIVNKLSNFVNKDILQHILIEDKKVHHAIKSRKELKEHFIWRTEYKLNAQQLDDEHKRLFDIAVKAIDHEEEDIKTHIKLTIVELYDYMKTHFEHEEEFMRKIGFPEIEEHIEIHLKIIDEMNHFIKTLPTLSIVEFEKKLIEFMDIWLINHIVAEDKKILKFKNS